jgi:hypothetical protein
VEKPVHLSCKCWELACEKPVMSQFRHRTFMMRLEPSRQWGIGFLPDQGNQMTARPREEHLPEDSSVPPADRLIFQSLGIAVMLCWNELPFRVRDQILNQSNDMIGVAPVQGIRDRIVGLLLRYRKA